MSARSILFVVIGAVLVAVIATLVLGLLGVQNPAIVGGVAGGICGGLGGGFVARSAPRAPRTG